MPKILINEIDQTSPGSPAGYANYAVLIPGFMGTPAASEDTRRKPDSNGVYEFSNTQQFIDTIGLLENARHTETKTGSFTIVNAKGEQESHSVSHDVFIEHYGNKMAHALLGLGYTVIYKPLTSLDDILNETSGIRSANFWNIFRDKASYDFRFVVHGLASSTSTADYTEYVEYDTRIQALEAAKSFLAEVIKDETLAGKDLTLQENMSLVNQLYQDKLDDLVANTDDNEARLIVLGLTPDTAEEPVNQYFAILPIVDVELETKKLALKFIEDSIIDTDIINEANAQIANLAAYEEVSAGTEAALAIPGRGDCTALIELDEKTYLTGNGATRPEEGIIAGINELKSFESFNADSVGTFCALTVPGVVYVGDEEGSKRFPGSFHYLACFMSSLQKGFAEWYAAAGYTRGVSSYVVQNTIVKLGEIAINALEPRYLIQSEAVVQPGFACNVIANFRGSYYLWGNRTAHPLGEYGNAKDGDLTASSFLNIRQLCSTIKKQLYVSCRRFTFDPNSDVLWINFVNAIKPTLDAMKADQGIRDYKIIKEATTQKATLKARIRIIPIEAVEDFDLTVSLEDSFGTTAAVTGDIQ